MVTASVWDSGVAMQVNREFAWQRFRHRGKSERLQKMLQLQRSRTACAVKGHRVLASKWHVVCTGLKQGDANAEMLFILYLDTLLREMLPEVIPTGLAYCLLGARGA